MTESQKIENGNFISSTGSYKQEQFTKSVVSYLSGIDKFDKLLDGRKFAETKYQFLICNYTDVVSFVIALDNKEISQFNISKDQISDIILEKNRPVEFDTLGKKEGQLDGLTRLIPLAGIVANAVDAVASATKKDKLFVKSETYPNGVIYEIVINDLQNSKIVFSTVEGNFLENVNSFFSNAFDFTFSAKFEAKKEENKLCYIATLCYGDIDALQVATFRTFRDNVLKKNFFGKVFIECYYFISPTLVKFLQRKNSINNFIRKQILDKIF